MNRDEKNDVIGLLEILNVDKNKQAKDVADEYDNWMRLPIVVGNHTLSESEKSLTLPAIRKCFTLVFVNRGAIEVTAEGKKGLVSAGYGIGITSDTKTTITVSDSSEANVDILVFNVAAIFSYGTTVMSVKYGMPYLNIKNHGFESFSITREVGTEIHKGMKSIMQYSKERPYGYELIIKARMCEIWYLIVRAFHAEAPNKVLNNTRKDEYRVKAALEYIEKHYMEPITLEDIAGELNICKSECCRCFGRVLELSPIEAVVRYRIYKAAAVFDDSEGRKKEIASVAISVGFNNISYFNKMFKKYVGVTPSEYKKRGVS